MGVLGLLQADTPVVQTKRKRGDPATDVKGAFTDVMDPVSPTLPCSCASPERCLA